MQSGIAADTLLFASYHRAKWSGAPVLVDVASAAGGLFDPKIDETFDDSEKFSIGVVVSSLKDCLDHYPTAKKKVALLMRNHCSHSLTAQKPSVRVCAIQSII